MIRYLASHSGRAISRDELLQRVMELSPRGLATRTIDMHVMRLREKLRDDSEQPQIVLTCVAKVTCLIHNQVVRQLEYSPTGSPQMFGFFQRPWQIWVAAGVACYWSSSALTWLTFKRSLLIVSSNSRDNKRPLTKMPFGIVLDGQSLGDVDCRGKFTSDAHYAATNRVSSVDTGHGANVKIPQNDQRMPANLLIRHF